MLISLKKSVWILVQDFHQNTITMPKTKKKSLNIKTFENKQTN